MTDPRSLDTPCLLVDLDRLDANIAAMTKIGHDHGVRLRPHAKTHKSPDIARRQLEAGAVGLTVATLGEAETFAAAGLTDLFVAYPLWVDATKARRIRALLEATPLSVGVDSVEAGQALAAQLGGDAGSVPVLVEVDSGQHRTGTTPDAAGLLAEVLTHAGLDVAGVFTFPGHGYAPGVQSAVAAEESDALGEAAASLRAHGVEPRVVSGGSTPTAAVTGPGADELRPGVYVFGDAQQWELGTTAPDRIALTCLATVVSHAGGRVVLDSGSKSLGADRPEWATGGGRLLDHPDARIVLLGEHHAVVDWGGGPLPPLGSRTRVVPNHVCNAVNLHDRFVVLSGDEVVDIWSVAARGANS